MLPCEKVTVRRNDYLSDLILDLKKRRILLGKSQEELNFDLGVTEKLVCKWESGKRTPSVFSLHCWADALGCLLTITPDVNTSKFSIRSHKAINDNERLKLIVNND